MAYRRAPRGKNANDAYVAVTARVPRELRDELKLELNRSDETLDINTLVEGLLRAWLSGAVKVSAPVEKPDINQVLSDVAKDAVFLTRYITDVEGSQSDAQKLLGVGWSTYYKLWRGIDKEKNNRSSYAVVSEELAMRAKNALLPQLRKLELPMFHAWQAEGRVLTENPQDQFETILNWPES